MRKPDYRYIYIVYAILAVIVAFWLDSKYHFTKDGQSTVSFIADISGLFGLAVALTEIVVLKKITKEIKASLTNIQALTDVADAANFLSQIKDDILSKKYGRAVLRLERVRDVYQEVVGLELTDPQSLHRANYDFINSMIPTLSMAEVRTSGKISDADLQQFVTFLTAFREILIHLKLTFKNSAA